MGVYQKLPWNAWSEGRAGPKDKPTYDRRAGKCNSWYA